MQNQRIRIRLKAFDHRLIDQSTAEIVVSACEFTCMDLQHVPGDDVFFAHVKCPSLPDKLTLPLLWLGLVFNAQYGLIDLHDASEIAAWMDIRT